MTSRVFQRERISLRKTIFPFDVVRQIEWHKKEISILFIVSNVSYKRQHLIEHMVLAHATSKSPLEVDKEDDQIV